MRFAYADPPYLGCCQLYGHPDQEGCWNEPATHARLIERLCADYPDGWAMSASSPSLRALLPLCPPDVRVAAWVKTFGAFKKGVRPAYMWEPVIFWRGRNPSAGHPHPPPAKGAQQTTPKDFTITVIEEEALPQPITLRKGFTGAKPPVFCQWVLDLLGYRDGDELDDVYPGTGVMGVVLAQGRLKLA